ncbi:imidazole glycerol phosphate synthase cyclase subunit (LPS cluster), putative [Pseudomonas chlororaphis subsp. piscium]|uniref:AglZ/HisF2 family acetamidino modification protein n=1 Tax=Pseudomonas chlororaphis TaxID=587753 RepID=UPI0006A5E565|nr:AglZ/HisF2 family acetamidino modification protein [Pseudomonas chlororaphis]AZC32612.1 imidazole glycerol phosphate synthase cyclase subunit (LPS cluster), putative [Pseudomonas chlororaphis subsp. piscium]WDG90312.1 AglZ/HisF2 family acetamidino modification protein [Pseudomonas chlororaphis]SDS58547.1 cyclase [Pseudomonas chlororaphis]
MLRPRIIPCLLIRNKGLVKTVKFKDSKYIGDPLNAVKIFNEKEVDELIVLDIDATTEGREPDYALIKRMAMECRMPFCYGGGISTADQARKIIGLGVEKIAISSAAIANPALVKEIAEEIGSQSVVVVLDVKKKLLGGRYEVWINNGKKNTGKCLLDMCSELQELGVGEIVINSIDYDGVMKGYNLDVAGKVYDKVHVPLTILGGAGSIDDIGVLIKKFGVVGAAAGSLFVFKGVYKAVLINYPTFAERDLLLDRYFPQ